MSLVLPSFPPPPSISSSIHSLSHLAVHEVSDNDIHSLLIHKGDFLIRSLPNSPTQLFFSVRDTKKVNDFQLRVDANNREDSFVFTLGNHSFSSVDELIFTATKGGFTLGGERIHCHQLIQRKYESRCPPIGHWTHATVPPRYAATTPLQLGDKGIPSSLLSLPVRFSRMVNDEDLEELIKMKHSNLLPLLDFTRLPQSALLLRFETFEVSMGAFLRDNPSTEGQQRLQWIQQAVSALFFLIDRGMYEVLLTPETAVLNNTDCLSLQLVHLGVDSSVDHWRWMAPETILLSVHSPSSLSWQLAIFIWQIYTNCTLLPFERFSDCRSMSKEALHAAGSGETCPLLFLPHSLSHEELNDSKKKEYYSEYGTMKTFPMASEVIRALFSSLFIFSPSESRLPWSSISRTLRSESIITRLSQIIDKILP